jgi:hypothetical protein
MIERLSNHEDEFDYKEIFKDLTEEELVEIIVGNCERLITNRDPQQRMIIQECTKEAVNMLDTKFPGIEE